MTKEALNKAEEIERLREENEAQYKLRLRNLTQTRIQNRKLQGDVERLREENNELREEVKDLQSVLRSYQLGFADEQ